MATYSRMSSLKEAVAQCPICTEIYDNDKRIPRRLPCCEQLTCELCLQVYSKNCRTIKCPLCRKDFTMSAGVRSLARDRTVLRFLDAYNETIPKCDDCPDGNRSTAKCSNCNVNLCQPCCDAHRRHSATRDHKITVLTQSTSGGASQHNVPEGRTRIPNYIAERLAEIRAKIGNLADAKDNVTLSKTAAMDTINTSFDDLAAELQQRRSTLLSLVDLQARKEEKSIIAALESHRDLQERIEQAIDKSSFNDINLSKGSVNDILYMRRGINFIDNDIKEIMSLAKSAGCVRVITFKPRERPDHLEPSSPCTTISIEYTKRDDESIFDQTMTVGKKVILCPHLVYDQSTASNDDLNIGPEISNFGSRQDLHDTGCRLQRKRSVFLSRPFRFTSIKRQMLVMRLQIKLKKMVPERASIWGTHCTKVPDDMNSSQIVDFDLDVATCSQHGTLCLRLLYDRKRHSCNPIMVNEPGTVRDLTLAVLLNSEDESIKVFDIIDIVPLGTVPGVDFSQPVWTMLTLGRPEWSEIKTQIIPARDVKLSADMMNLLSRYL